MDMLARTNREGKKAKFTKGEKCIFVHLAFTFVVIILLVIAFSLHLWSVPHSGGEAFRVSERISVRAGTWSVSRRVGLVLAGSRRACGGVHVRRLWAVAPAHCVSARVLSDLPDYVTRWTIRYQLQNDQYTETDIIRGIVHSLFDRDDFNNNIGLFEQSDPIFMDELKLNFVAINDELLQKYLNNMSVFTWTSDYASRADRLEDQPVQPVTAQQCARVVAPVRGLAAYEFCVYYNNDIIIEHGSAVAMDSEIRGLFVWGDKQGHLPLIIINIGFYKDWIESFIP